jgi:hypothetical protein
MMNLARQIENLYRPLRKGHWKSTEEAVPPQVG